MWKTKVKCENLGMLTEKDMEQVITATSNAGHDYGKASGLFVAAATLFISACCMRFVANRKWDRKTFHFTHE